MSSGIALVIAVIGFLALFAAAVVLVLSVRRPARTRVPAGNGESTEAAAGGQRQPAGSGRADKEAQQRLDEATRAAERVRAASASAGIVRRAEQSAEDLAATMLATILGVDSRVSPPTRPGRRPRAACGH